MRVELWRTAVQDAVRDAAVARMRGELEQEAMDARQRDWQRGSCGKF